MLSPEAQLEVLKLGSAQIISEAELLAKLRRGKPLNIKLGVDPTAPDIHLGHTVALRRNCGSSRTSATRPSSSSATSPR